MKWTVGTKIAGGFALTLLVFVIVGVVSYRGTTQLMDTTELRRNTYEVLASRDELMSTVRAVGVALRTYIIIGDDSQLQNFRTWMGRAEDALREVRSRQSVKAEQRQQGERLSASFSDYTATAWKLAERRRDGGITAAAEMLTSDQTRLTLERLS